MCYGVLCDEQVVSVVVMSSRSLCYGGDATESG